MKTDKVTIKIPRELYKKLGPLIEGSGFSSVTEFVVFTMRTVAMGGKIEGEKYTKKEVEKIRQRLRNLGYFG